MGRASNTERERDRERAMYVDVEQTVELATLKAANS